jgi:hypothetical protein
VDLAVEVAAWLDTAEGRAAARRASDRHGVAYLLDDLVSDVLYRAVVHDGAPVANVAAFTTVLLRRAAIDLLRGERRRFVPSRAEPPAEDVAADTAVDVAATAVHAEVAHIVRRELGRRLGTRPWVGAACLARLAAELDHASISDDAPRPAGGAGEQEAIDWAALWYAGQDDCFPPPGGSDDPATRRRRSRAIVRVRSLLADAASTIDGVTADG